MRRVFAFKNMGEFRAKLLDISQELTTGDVKALKFLYSEIPRGRAEFITTPLELFQELERMNILREDTLDSLAEHLGLIGRKDLERKLLALPTEEKITKFGDDDHDGVNTASRKAESFNENREENQNVMGQKTKLPSKLKSKNTKSYKTKKGESLNVKMDDFAGPAVYNASHLKPPSSKVVKEDEFPKFEILHGEAIEDHTRKRKFQAHVSDITSLEQAEQVLAQLKKDPEIAKATHNVWACRIYDEQRKIYIKESDDDEENVGGILLDLLESSDTKNAVVVVTVDYQHGGKLLQRFSRLSIRYIMMCARNLLEQTSRKIKDDTVPAEILARGPEALKAYEEALESGKTKNLRLLVMAVGPARAGKTSLLKSFNGELFDPKEDSTIGIQQTVCKSQENCWSKDSDESISYTDCMADVICQNLQEENKKKNAEASKKPTKETAEHSPNFPKNDDVNGDGDGADGVEETSSKAESLENQEYGRKKSTKNIPKSIEEKLLDKLKDTKNDKKKENELYVKTVDLAGQAVYNVIHPIFLTPRAVFILVYNLKNILHDPMKSKVEKGGSERELVDPFEMTNLENLELWLSCISSYTDAQKKTQVDGLSLPPVFIAGTHADTFGSDLEAAKQVIRDIYKSLSPSKNPSGCHVKRDEIYTVNNKKSGNGEIKDESVRKLKADIEKLSKSLPHMNEDIPMNWLLFEEELSNLVKKENKKYITINEARKMANECKVNTSAESKEFPTLMNYLHDLKSIIYFEETKLVFIDTQWLVEVFTKVIKVTPAEKRGGLDESWDKLEEEGVLERTLVEHVWKGLVDEGNTVDSLLLIMEKFSLICRWSTSEGEDVYFVPAMLCNSKKREDIAKFLNHQMTSTMVIRFSTSHISLGIFPRLFVAIVEEGKKRWPQLRPKLHKNFCRIFNVGKERKLDICVIQSSPRTISVTVCNKQNINEQRVTEFCKHFLEMLHEIFEDMQRSFPWMQNMIFEYGILCPVCAGSSTRCKSHEKEGCTRDSCFHFVKEEELRADPLECDKDVACLGNVIEEEAYSYWFPRQSPEEEIEENDNSEPSVLAVYKNSPPLVDVHELQSICPVKAAERVAICLQLDKTSLKEPPAEVVKTCRSFCIHFLKPHKRLDIMKELRTTLPSGMTGPLTDENDLYEDLDFEKRKFLTQSLCGEEVWKCLASEFKISNSRHPFFSQQRNPAQEVLEDVCSRRRLTVGELYDIIVKCGAAAIADEYL